MKWLKSAFVLSKRRMKTLGRRFRYGLKALVKLPYRLHVKVAPRGVKHALKRLKWHIAPWTEVWNRASRKYNSDNAHSDGSSIPNSEENRFLRNSDIPLEC